MSNKIIELYYKHSRIIKYGVIGAWSSFIDVVSYTILVMASVNMLVANVIGVHIGIMNSFILNRRYNFRVKDYTKQRFISFYIIGLLGLALSSGFLYLFVDGIGMNEIIAKVITIVIVALFQFVLNSRITFKRK